MSHSDNPEMVVSAIINGDHAALEGYLSSGGNPDLLYRDRSLIHWAAQESNREAARLLLARGASLEIQDKEGHFPLYQAAGEGSLEIVQLFVEAGAVVNRVCDSGSALSIACAFGHLEVASYLVSVGADLDLPDSEGETARSILEGANSPMIAAVAYLGRFLSSTTPLELL